MFSRQLHQRNGTQPNQPEVRDLMARYERQEDQQVLRPMANSHGVQNWPDPFRH
jgi:hypothetical protein